MYEKNKYKNVNSSINLNFFLKKKSIENCVRLAECY